MRRHHQFGRFIGSSCCIPDTKHEVALWDPQLREIIDHERRNAVIARWVADGARRRTSGLQDLSASLGELISYTTDRALLVLEAVRCMLHVVI
jgi:hypothetical protein